MKIESQSILAENNQLYSLYFSLLFLFAPLQIMSQRGDSSHICVCGSKTVFRYILDKNFLLRFQNNLIVFCGMYRKKRMKLWLPLTHLNNSTTIVVLKIHINVLSLRFDKDSWRRRHTRDSIRGEFRLKFPFSSVGWYFDFASCWENYHENSKKKAENVQLVVLEIVILIAECWNLQASSIQQISQISINFLSCKKSQKCWWKSHS